jgi:hypothetical protein
MKVLLSKVFVDPIEKIELPLDARRPDGAKLTLKSVLATSLRLGSQDPKDQPSGDEHSKRWKLMNRISESGDELELSSEDAVLLKKLVEKAFISSVVVGQAQDILDGK